MEYLTLNNGIEMPALGLGTYPMQGKELIKTVVCAAALGYRSFDTSAAYGNEYALGWGIRLCLKQRKKLFLTSKVSNKQQNIGNMRQSLSESLERLHTNYLDLYLLHWPNPGTYVECWKQLEELYMEGRVRAIGVCNFHKHHLENLMEQATITPAVNQVELHPLLSQEQLAEYCFMMGIKIICYSPLARMDNKLVNDLTLIQIAKKYSKTVPQIILRWDFQKGYCTIPKTSKAKRLKQNLDIFDIKLSTEDIKKIDNINCDYRVRYDPDNCNFSKL